MNLWWIYPAAAVPGAAMTARTLWRQHRAATAAARAARVQQQRADRDADINTRLDNWRPTDADLAQHVAMWAAPRDPQTGREER